MTLLSNRTDFDRLAGIRAEAGIASQRATPPWTIGEAVNALEAYCPTTEQELQDFVRLCDMWNVKTNVSLESWWLNLLEEDSK